MNANPDSPPQSFKQVDTPRAVPAGGDHDKHADFNSEKLYKVSDETRNDAGKQHPILSYASESLDIQ